MNKGFVRTSVIGSLIIVVAFVFIIFFYDLPKSEAPVIDKIENSEVPTTATSTEPVATTTPDPIEKPIITKPIVEPKPTPTPTPSKQCFVGGCSSQVCSSQPDMVSTCEWREEYACYQKATCEVQRDGECGWTETPELNSCLASSGEASM